MKNCSPILKLLLILPIFSLLHSCEPEEVEEEPAPAIAFEEGIQGTWYNSEYYAEYFDEDGNLLFTERMDVFIESINIDEEHVTYNYKSSSPDWRSVYAPQTREGQDYIIFFSPFPDILISELTETTMIWKETTDGGTFDDDMGNIQVQADHKIRTFKFFR